MKKKSRPDTVFASEFDALVDAVNIVLDDFAIGREDVYDALNVSLGDKDARFVMRALDLKSKVFHS